LGAESFGWEIVVEVDVMFFWKSIGKEDAAVSVKGIA